MKTLITVIAASAVVLPMTANAGMCSNKGYHKHQGYYQYSGYYPYAYQPGYYPRGGGYTKGYRGKMHRHHHAYAQPSDTSYPTGANMYYLHLPQDEKSKNLSQAASQAAEQPENSEAANTGLNDLITTAANAGKFNTLIEAVKAAGLEQTLTAEGPFTLFAPTDEAFSRLPKSILKALTDDPRALADLLKAHVVGGRVTAADAMKLDSAQSVQGSQLQIVNAEGVSINGAQVITTDIEASNGIIHVIDSVIFPQS